MGHWTRWMRDKEVDRLEKELTDLRDELYKRTDHTSCCKRCHSIFRYGLIEIRGGMYHPVAFDGLSLDYCYHCFPEEERKRKLAEWARNNPDSAEECKKKYEKETK